MTEAVPTIFPVSEASDVPAGAMAQIYHFPTDYEAEPPEEPARPQPAGGWKALRHSFKEFRRSLGEVKAEVKTIRQIANLDYDPRFNRTAEPETAAEIDIMAENNPEGSFMEQARRTGMIVDRIEKHHRRFRAREKIRNSKTYVLSSVISCGLGAAVPEVLDKLSKLSH